MTQLLCSRAVATQLKAALLHARSLDIYTNTVHSRTPLESCGSQAAITIIHIHFYQFTPEHYACHT